MGLEELYRLPQVSPEEWGAAMDYDSWEDRVTNMVFGHWGGTPVLEAAALGELSEEAEMLRRWEAYHLSKGWRGIAYDWAIGNSGKLYRLRGDAQSAGTSGDIDLDGIPNNVEAEAIVFIIGTGQVPTLAAFSTFQMVLDTLAYGRENVFGHRESHQRSKTGIITSCPGPDVMGAILGYRATGRVSVDLPSPKPKPTPSPSTPWQQEVITSMDTINLSDVTSNSRTWVRGEDIKTVQGLLVARGFAPRNTIRPDGSLDGVGGPGTKEALGKFQRATKTGNRDGSPDYIIGENTWTALLRA